LTYGRIAAAVLDGRFSYIRHVATVCLSIRAHWSIIANTIKRVISLWPAESTTRMANRSVQPCCTTHRNAAPHLPSKLHFSMGIWAPYNTWFFGPTRVLNATVSCPKMPATATSLRTSKSAMSSWHSLTPKTHPEIKQCVAGYHTIGDIAHKASYSKLRPKNGGHGNVPQHF